MIGIPALVFWTDCFQDRDALRRAFPKQTPDRIGLTMLSAVGFTIVGMVITVLWMSVLSMFHYSPKQLMMANPQTHTQLLLAVLAASIIPAACEEMLFRGVLLRFVSGKWGDNAAIWVTAVLFAALHFSAPGFPMLLMIGVLLARLALTYKGLTLPFIFHAMYNFSAVVINRYGAAPSLLTIIMALIIFRRSTSSLLFEKEA